MSFFSKVVLAWVAVLAGANGVIQLQPARAHAGAGQASASSPPAPLAQPAASDRPARQAADSPHRLLLRRYCTSCHSDRLETGDLSLEALDLSKVGEAAETWEKVVRKLRGGIMPPVGAASRRRRIDQSRRTSSRNSIARQPPIPIPAVFRCIA